MTGRAKKSCPTRRRVMLGAGALALAPRTLRAGDEEAPNIVFIMADDLGWADLGCYGRDDIETPNIDRLARQGMRFTNAYANSCVCSPTRVALMTGRYQYRVDVGLDEPLGKNPDRGLDPSQPTISRLMKDSGYRTALIGKWHLGAMERFSPLKHGYDELWGIKGGGRWLFRLSDADPEHCRLL